MAVVQLHSTSTPYLVLSLSIILLLSPSRPQAESFKYCDKNEDYPVKVGGVEILPDPVARGEPFTFKIGAYTGEAIPSGDLLYEISYVGVEAPPAAFLHDLCEETPCPVPAGNFVLTHTELLPTVTPPGTYKVKLTFKAENEKQLSCIIFPFKIGAGSSVSAI